MAVGVQTEIIEYPFNKRMKDLTGQRFGRLTVQRYVGITGKARRAVWECKCDCGNIQYFVTNTLTTGTAKSCGCLWKESVSVDHTGKRFGKLLVLKKLEKTNKLKGGSYYLCQCDCGNLCEVHCNDLTCGNVSSCGCLRSRKEYDISLILKNNNIDFKQQYYFSDLKDQRYLRFDFAIFKNQQLSCLLEYNGIQHYNQSDHWYKESTMQHDIMKKEYCEKHNIPLIIINADNYNKLLDLIQEFI